MIHSRCLPPGTTAELLPQGPRKFQTVAGTMTTQRMVWIDNLSLPEFDKSKQIDAGRYALVFDAI